MDVFMGTILTFGFNFPPRNWALCAGQLIPISQNSALFALLGTTYGGNGQTTFALPNLQGRIQLGMGNGPGLTPRAIGEVSGTESVTLTQTNMPMHTHAATFTPTASSGVQVSTNTVGNTVVPSAANSYLSGSPAGPTSAAIWSATLTDPIAMGGVAASGGTVAVGVAGGSQPFGIMNPFLALNFSIALQGIFPSRN